MSDPNEMLNHPFFLFTRIIILCKIVVYTFKDKQRDGIAASNLAACGSQNLPLYLVYFVKCPFCFFVEGDGDDKKL